MIKRYFYFLVIIIAFFHFMSGCGNKNDYKKDAITIWHWMTDRHDTFKMLENKYFEETREKVIFELNAPSDLFTFKVRAAAQTNTLPDIYGVLGGKEELANFINAGLVLPLTQYLDENEESWKNSLFPKSLEVTTFVEGNQWNVIPGNYGVPIDVTNIQLIYNKQIFKDAGVKKIPETWDEFIKTGELITKKLNGIKYFVCGFGETWIINSIVRNFAVNLIGKENFIKTLKGELSYNTAEWVEIFSKFKELTDKGLFSSGVVTLGNKNAERVFVTKKAAVTYNGSWSTNVFRGMNPNLEYGAMFFPTISDNHPVVIQGGAGSSFIISAKSEKREKAVKFLKWLTSKDAQNILAKETNNLPSNNHAGGEIKGMLSEFSDDMDHIIHPSSFPFIEDPDLLESMARGVQSIIIGESTPESLAASLEKMKETILKEKK